MNVHLIVGLALIALAGLTGRWAYFAAIGAPRLPEGRRWDWNLWSICQCWSAVVGAAYFISRGFGAS